MAAGHNAKFGFVELMIFLLALISGTSCTLTSKALLDMKGIGMTGEEEAFSFPLFQTFGMFFGKKRLYMPCVPVCMDYYSYETSPFVAMLIALLMHFLVLTFHIPFPGYTHKKDKDAFDEVCEAVSCLLC